jgi:hypothetical protein
MHPKRSNKNCTEAILCVQGDGDGEREKKREKRSSEREEKRSARIDKKIVSQPSPGEEQKARQHLPFEFSFAVDYCSCVGQLLFQGGKLFRSQRRRQEKLPQSIFAIPPCCCTSPPFNPQLIGLKHRKQARTTKLAAFAFSSNAGECSGMGNNSSA